MLSQPRIPWRGIAHRTALFTALSLPDLIFQLTPPCVINITLLPSGCSYNKEVTIGFAVSRRGAATGGREQHGYSSNRD